MMKSLAVAVLTVYPNLPTPAIDSNTTVETVVPYLWCCGFTYFFTHAKTSISFH